MAHSFSWLVFVCWCGGLSCVQSNDDLQFDENRRVSQNAILYQDSPHCLQRITQVWTQNNGYSTARDLIPLNETALARFHEARSGQRVAFLPLSLPVSQSCLAVCVNEGTAEDHIYDPLPHLIYSEQAPEQEQEQHLAAGGQDDDIDRDKDKDRDRDRADRHQLLDWNYECRVAEVSVISFQPEELTLVWIDTLNAGIIISLLCLTLLPSYNICGSMLHHLYSPAW